MIEGSKPAGRFTLRSGMHSCRTGPRGLWETRVENAFYRGGGSWRRMREKKIASCGSIDCMLGAMIERNALPTWPYLRSTPCWAASKIEMRIGCPVKGR